MAWSQWFRRTPSPLRRRSPRLAFDLLEARDVPASTFLGSPGLPTTQATGNSVSSGSRGRAFSSDGRYYVFYSEASNLVAGDTNNASDVFVADLQQGTIKLVSSLPDGTF